MKKIKRKYRSIVKNNKVYKKTNYIIIFIITIMIVISAFFIKLGYDYNKKILPIYNYNIQKNDDYIVSLKENVFYTSKTLPSGKYYASKSVDSYIINFKYNFKGNLNTDLEYKYNITADLVGTVVDTDEQDKEVWTRNYILKKDIKNKQENINQFSLNEKINIDYENYNNLVRAYENQYGINIDAVLKVRFNISYNINLSKLNVDSQSSDDYIELDIPITNTVTQVNKNYENTLSKDIYPNFQNTIKVRIIYYIIGGLFILAAIIIIIVNIKKHKKTPIEMYNKNINNIFKYYKDLIVTVTNSPDISNLKVMHLVILDDLIDVAEQNKSNIIHYETIQNKKSNLYVIVGNYVYVYEVSNKELR